MAGLLLFGGSFDPIHHGHLIISRWVSEHLDTARVVLIPSASPPHKQGVQLAPPAARLEMCRRAVEDDPGFEVCDWETHQAGPNYTLRTVQHFRKSLPAGDPLYWLIGMDSLAELGTWYRVGELAEACTLVTAGRPGHPRPDLSGLAGMLTQSQICDLERNILETPLIDISATEIRARVQAGGSIRYLVPEPVWQYIREQGLYSVE